MTTSLSVLIHQAMSLADPELTCRVMGHSWTSLGGRVCPRNEYSDCSQPVYQCHWCGEEDYGDFGGPGFADCFLNGPCDRSCVEDGKSKD